MPTCLNARALLALPASLVVSMVTLIWAPTALDESSDCQNPRDAFLDLLFFSHGSLNVEGAVVVELSCSPEQRFPCYLVPFEAITRPLKPPLPCS